MNGSTKLVTLHGPSVAIRLMAVADDAAMVVGQDITRVSTMKPLWPSVGGCEPIERDTSWEPPQRGTLCVCVHARHSMQGGLV